MEFMCHVWGERIAHRVLVEKPEGKRALGRPWCKEKLHFKIYFH
jgi:hypothetical protein